jgi:predicted  nucleic acid-binding Zn-ribbon protein
LNNKVEELENHSSAGITAASCRIESLEDQIASLQKENRKLKDLGKEADDKAVKLSRKLEESENLSSSSDSVAKRRIEGLEDQIAMVQKENRKLKDSCKESEEKVSKLTGEDM